MNITATGRAALSPLGGGNPRTTVCIHEAAVPRGNGLRTSRESSRSLPALCLVAVLSYGCSSTTLDDARTVIGHQNDYRFLLDRYERRCGSRQPTSAPVPPSLAGSSKQAEPSSGSACAAAYSALLLYKSDAVKATEGVGYKGPIALWLKALKKDLKVCLSALKASGAALP